MEALQSSLAAIPVILAAMALVAALDVAIPLHARGRWNRAHLAPNLALTAITLAATLVMNTALVTALLWLHGDGFGLLNAVSLPPLAAGAIGVVLLDFSFCVERARGPGAEARRPNLTPASSRGNVPA
jgi:hypothetical protein